MKKVAIAILIMAGLFIFFVSNLCLPLVEVVRYFDSDLFYVADATIIDKYTEYNNIKMNWSDEKIIVQYVINGENRSESIYSKKKDRVGDHITIVTSKKGFYVYRIPIDYTYDDFEDSIPIALCVILIIDLITNPPARVSRRQIKNENNTKVEDLLKFYHRNINDSKNDCKYIKKYLKSVNATKLYNDFSLVIKNVQLDELIECGFLLRKNSGGEFDFIIKTKEFWDRRHLQDHLVLREVVEGYIVYSIRDDSIYFYNEKTYKYEFVTTSLIKYLIMIKENKFSIGYIGND